MFFIPVHMFYELGVNGKKLNKQANNHCYLFLNFFFLFEFKLPKDYKLPK